MLILVSKRLPQVPTGEIASVCGTFFDFSKERALGEAIDGLGGDPPGIDNCLVLVGTSDGGEAKVRLGSSGLEGRGRDSKEGLG